MEADGPDRQHKGRHVHCLIQARPSERTEAELQNIRGHRRRQNKEPPPPRHYIYATRNGPGDVFRQFSERAKNEPGWKSYELDASHNPHITCPDALMALLTRIMPNTWADK